MKTTTTSFESAFISKRDLILNALDIAVTLLCDDSIYLYRESKDRGIRVSKSEFIRLVESIKSQFA